MYDVIIIGAGPAGLSAGLYAARANLDVVILEKMYPGGQIAITDEVDNYPGSEPNASGPSLTARMAEQAKHFGAKIVTDSVQDISLEGHIKVVEGKKNTYEGKTVIIATGGRPRLIGCPGEKEFTGRGVSYCATCDAPFFRDLEVFVVGGGDAAVEEALYITKFARKVTIVHRRDELRAAKSIVEKAKVNEKISFMWDTVIDEIKGGNEVEAAVFKNVKTGETKEYKAAPEDGTFGIFPFIGFLPVSELFEGKVEMDGGYIITDENMRTNVGGVFAAGDVRVKSLRQVITAAADGAIAATHAEKYIESNEQYYFGNKI